MTLSNNGRNKRIEAVDIFEDEQHREWIRLEDETEHLVFIDPSYQRPLDQRKVEQIRTEWDPIAAGEITLSIRRGGKIAVVDGQHLMVAALLENEGSLLAEVWEGLTPAREAAVRLIKNNRRPDTALEKFHAELKKEQGHGTATSIVELLAEFGTFINKQPTSHVGINCVGAIKRIYARDEGVILRRTLALLKETYQDLNGQVVSASLLGGASWFLTVHFGDYRGKTLVEQLRKNGPDGVLDISRGFKRAMGGAEWLNVYRAIVEAYNKGVRKAENKLELKTSRWSYSDVHRDRESRWVR